MNENLRRDINELQEEVQSNSLILDQAKVNLQECKEQKKQLTLQNESLEKKLRKIDSEQSLFIDKIKSLEKQHAHQFKMAGHELAVLTQDSFNDLMIELNEMNRKCAEQEEQLESTNLLKTSCEEKEAKIVELTKMYTDKIESIDKNYQERISYLSQMLGGKSDEEKIMKSKNAQLKSELDKKSKHIEKSKKEISSLKGIITKNENKTKEFEEKLEKIFNKINDKQNGKKNSFQIA